MQTDVVGSLLTYTVSAPQGISNVRTGSQTSDTPTTYSEGMIFRRSNDIAIVLYDSTSNKVYTNRKPSATDWVGWSTFIQDSDLADVTNGLMIKRFFNDGTYTVASGALRSANIPIDIPGGYTMLTYHFYTSSNPDKFSIGGYFDSSAKILAPCGRSLVNTSAAINLAGYYILIKTDSLGI